MSNRKINNFQRIHQITTQQARNNQNSENQLQKKSQKYPENIKKNMKPLKCKCIIRAEALSPQRYNHLKQKIKAVEANTQNMKQQNESFKDQLQLLFANFSFILELVSINMVKKCQQWQKNWIEEKSKQHEKQKAKLIQLNTENKKQYEQEIKQLKAIIQDMKRCNTKSLISQSLTIKDKSIEKQIIISRPKDIFMSMQLSSKCKAPKNELHKYQTRQSLFNNRSYSKQSKIKSIATIKNMITNMRQQIQGNEVNV